MMWGSLHAGLIWLAETVELDLHAYSRQISFPVSFILLCITLEQLKQGLLNCSTILSPCGWYVVIRNLVNPKAAHTLLIMMLSKCVPWSECKISGTLNHDNTSISNVAMQSAV